MERPKAKTVYGIYTLSDHIARKKQRLQKSWG